MATARTTDLLSGNVHDDLQALAVLEAAKHWTLTTINRNRRKRRYECTIWANGRRVSGQGKTLIACVNRALSKLRTKSPLAKSSPTGLKTPTNGLRIASYVEE